MSISTPTCNFFSTPTPIQSGGDMLHFQPGHQIENGEQLPLSLSELPPFKKQRVCDALVLNQKTPVTVNLVNKPLSDNWNGDHKVIAEMQLCRMFYYTRKCMYEDRCRFSHVNNLEKVKQDFGRFKGSSLMSIGTSGCPGDQRSGFGQFASKEFGHRVNSRLLMWKTKLCRNWEMNGGCPYRKTCRFAHGQAELHKLGRHSALESRMMRTNVSNTFSAGNGKSGTSWKHQVQGMNCAIKWKGLEKTNGIYADWIEDAPLHNSFN